MTTTDNPHGHHLYAGGAQAADPPTLIVSYPKSGRTWLRVMMGKLLCDRLGLSDSESLDLRALTMREAGRTGARVTDFTHDQTAMLGGLPASALTPDKSAYAGRRILFLTRDLRDLMVSCYFQATRRIGRFDGSISAFIRDERFGVVKVLTFYRHWHAAREVPDRFVPLAYETMVADPAAALRAALALSDIVADPSEITAAVAFGRFDGLQARERAGYFRSKILRPGDGSDPESFKIRSGKVGGYRHYLSAEDIAHIDAVEARLGNPFRPQDYSAI